MGLRQRPKTNCQSQERRTGESCPHRVPSKFFWNSPGCRNYTGGPGRKSAAGGRLSMVTTGLKSRPLADYRCPGPAKATAISAQPLRAGDQWEDDMHTNRFGGLFARAALTLIPITIATAASAQAPPPTTPPQVAPTLVPAAVVG